MAIEFKTGDLVKVVNTSSFGYKDEIGIVIRVRTSPALPIAVIYFPRFKKAEAFSFFRLQRLSDA